MKFFIFLAVCMFMFISCVTDDPDSTGFNDGDVSDVDYDSGSNPDIEEEEIITDHNNEPGDDSSQVTNDDNEVFDEGSVELPDENSGGDDVDNEAECGNGVVEDGEICDMNKIPCSELSPEYIGGEATCKDDCLGWDSEYCFGADPVEPLATISPKSFTVEYLYNGADAFSYGANQDNELWDGPLFSSSITLTTGTYYIPHNLSDAHWLAGFYDAQSVQFVQQSFVLSSGAFTLPYVVMGALKSAVVKDAVLSIGITDENEVNFVVFDMMNDEDCVILVGYGTLTVNSISIAQGSAGEFQFSTSEIGLFLPSETPEGNVMSDIQNAGFTICQ